MKTRYLIGELDVFSGILFIIGLIELKDNPAAGIFLMGLGLLKQFSGK